MGWQTDTWIEDDDDATTYFAAAADNLTLDTSPFVDEEGGDLHLDPTGAAFGLPGFADVPLDEIGVRD